jgi:hypothetical protein
LNDSETQQNPYTVLGFVPDAVGEVDVGNVFVLRKGAKAQKIAPREW